MFSGLGMRTGRLLSIVVAVAPFGRGRFFGFGSQHLRAGLFCAAPAELIWGGLRFFVCSLL